jgi:hypothetical protein
VIYPVHPFNLHVGQPMRPPLMTGSYLIYPVHAFHPHANQPTPPQPVAGSYMPSAMVYPATGSPDVLLSMLRPGPGMDPNYTGLFSYSSVPVQQQQHGLAFHTGLAHSSTPL